MSDDEADPELMELLRQHLQGRLVIQEDADTGVLSDAEYVYNQGTDVAIDMMRTKEAAEIIWAGMQAKSYSPATWSEYPLHPKLKDETTVAFIFTMDLLNFCFWSELPEDERFAVEYEGKRWTGYASLVASLQRALQDGVPITDPAFWKDEEKCDLDALQQVFRSCTEEDMPLLQERLNCLRQASKVLDEKYEGSILNLVEAADKSAPRLVNLLAEDFECFRDEHPFEGRNKPIRILKRAQILVADLWACFEGKSFGEFRDIDSITIFADYRVPQILSTLGALWVGPKIAAAVRDKKILESGTCSIWCVELLKREIKRAHPEAHVNAVLIDFYLYDTMKQMEAEGNEPIPHHRTRSIWY
ncbi:UPF0553 protein [Escovopsis weberi]|uniref:Queuosine 5'-phosphate N-glycosylase/hydrolase n=1 Tax=Escovopsis weberi TaxID=150374 RepID=A0A0M8N987_ESCWE|nr:UPF0553 protein [Escovopsis weberi]